MHNVVNINGMKCNRIWIIDLPISDMSFVKRISIKKFYTFVFFVKCQWNSLNLESHTRRVKTELYSGGTAVYPFVCRRHQAVSHEL